jgi:hypothetical protein
MSIDDVTVMKIYKDICYYGKIVESVSFSERVKCCKIQLSFIRKNILGLMYANNNNSAKGIKSGYVYAIGNPAWNEYVKIGSSIDVYDGLNSYQTASPFRDYELIGYVFTHDRFLFEKQIHQKFDDKNSEWVKTDKLTIKKYLKSFEQFPSQNIVNFSLAETLRAIGVSDEIKNCDSQRNKLKAYFKKVKHVLKPQFIWMKDADVDSKLSIQKIKDIWTCVDLKISVRVVEDEIILEKILF